MTILSNRYDFTLIFDVTNGNPNGDPDAGNLPRTDSVTGKGLVSDVCLKRKIRNYVDQIYRDDRGDPHRGLKIYVEEGTLLNEKHREASGFLKNPSKASDNVVPINEEAYTTKPKNDNEKKGQDLKKRYEFMCKNFFDVRTFGAVMNTGDVKCGTARGPVQMTFATSVEQIRPLTIAITKTAATKLKPATKKNQDKDNDNDVETGKMGSKHIVPYGLYVAHGFVSANLAKKTWFEESDLDLVWEALDSMFEHDRSAARGLMSKRKLIIFKHDCELGKAPAHVLFDLVRTGRNIDGEFYPLDDKRLGNQPPARKFSDYIIEIDRENCPDGVTIIER